MKIVAVFINLVFFLLLAPFLEGVMRKITARVQSRQGPPLYQPYLDLLKLLRKENLVSAENWAFRLAPLLAFASMLAAVAILPLHGQENILSHEADLMTLIYLLTLSGFSVLIGALSSGNPFGSVGASREMMTIIMLEPVLAMTIILGAVRNGTMSLPGALQGVASTESFSYFLMLAVYLLALQAFVSRQPFDIPEAEVEILEGPYIEYSGPNYALFRYTLNIKRTFYAWLLAGGFLSFLRPANLFLDLLLQTALIILLFGLISVVGATHPRFRIDQAIKYYALLIVLSLLAVGLGVSGL
ncbi:MAG: NADH-quinone oxidoreductase subunit H [Candidatus Saccharicenans sp.]|jgi:formate hydrogenlyase subunit 4|nr:NADH-quinone oxidoreductase subunit H [Candidatus Saccharicenans sp.]MDH7492901.1 NADH-quinone oxidoreductase subunit H [Candidatus Saccharicenans sp.]